MHTKELKIVGKLTKHQFLACIAIGIKSSPVNHTIAAFFEAWPDPRRRHVTVSYHSGSWAPYNSAGSAQVPALSHTPSAAPTSSTGPPCTAAGGEQRQHQQQHQQHQPTSPARPATDRNSGPRGGATCCTGAWGSHLNPARKRISERRCTGHSRASEESVQAACKTCAWG